MQRCKTEISADEAVAKTENCTGNQASRAEGELHVTLQEKKMLRKISGRLVHARRGGVNIEKKSGSKLKN